MPLLWLLSFALLFDNHRPRRERQFGVVTMVVALAALPLMLYRGYFTSLGW